MQLFRSAWTPNCLSLRQTGHRNCSIIHEVVPSLNSSWRREYRPMIDERCSITFADTINYCNLESRIRETVRSDLVSVLHSRWKLNSRCMDGECQSLLESVDKHSAPIRIPLVPQVCQRFDDKFPRIN